MKSIKRNPGVIRGRPASQVRTFMVPRTPAPLALEVQTIKLPVRTLSYSSINNYNICGRWWHFANVLKIARPHAPAAFFGTVFHKAAQDYLSNRRSLVLSWSSAWPQLRQEWETDISGMPWGSIDPNKWYIEGLNLCRDPRVIKTLDSIELGYDPDGTPLIEKFFSLDVPEVSLPLIGYIDVIDYEGIPYDFKVTSNAWDPKKTAEEIQPIFYLYALHRMGRPSPDNTFRHVVIVRGQYPLVQIFETQIDPDRFEWLETLIRQTFQGIQSGVFQYANAGHWKCNPKWCEFWDRCKGKYSASGVSKIV